MAIQFVTLPGTGQKVGVATDSDGTDWQFAAVSYEVSASVGVSTMQKVSVDNGLPIVPATGATFTVLGNVASGATDSGNPVKAAGVYNSSPITLTNAERGDLQLDANGYLNVHIAAGLTGNGAVSATGSAVPAQADYGGLNVAGTLRGQTGVNPSGSVYAGQVDVSSVGGTTLVLGQATKAASLPVALASDQGNIPTNTAQVNGVTPLMGNGISGTGAQRVTIASDSTGQIALAAGAAIAGKFTTDQTTHGTTDLVAADITKVAGSAIAQGHGTAAAAIRVELPTDGSGQVNALLPAAFTGSTSVPATQIQTVQGNAAGVPIPIASTDPAATTGSITLVDAASVNTTASLITGQTIWTGTPTAGSAVAITLTGQSTIEIELSGTSIATVVFEKSFDAGASYIAFSPLAAGTDLPTSSITSVSTSTITLLESSCAGLTNIRVRCTAFTSGTVAVRILASFSVKHILESPVPYKAYSYITSGAANQDATQIKTTGGKCAGIWLSNNTASNRYLRIYDLATSPTSASGSIIGRYLIPPTGGSNAPRVRPFAFIAGLAFRVTTGAADNDAGSCSASDVFINADLNS